MKTILRKIHLYLGLISGLIVFIVSITGALYAFKDEIEAFTLTYKNVPARDSKMLLPSEAISIAEHAKPGISVHGIIYRDSTDAIEAIYYQADPFFYGATYINPYSGEVIKTVNFMHTFFGFVRRGHATLWLPMMTGYITVALGSIIFVIMLISGIVLWWPRKNSSSKSFSFSAGDKSSVKLLEKHKVIGFYSFFLALIIVLTGLSWLLRGLDRAIYKAMGGEKEIVWNPPLSDTLNTNGNTFEGEAVDVIFAQLKKDNPEIGFIEIHAVENDSASVLVELNRDPSSHRKIDYLHFDQYTLEPIASDNFYGSYDDAKTADKIKRAYYDIHTGGILGLPGKFLAFFVSLFCASLPVTGFMLWWKRLKKKKAFAQKMKSQNGLNLSESHDNTKSDILILYATSTGNAKKVAEFTESYLKNRGNGVYLTNTKKFSPHQLKNYKNLLVVISTDGEGEPPSMANRFFDVLNSREMPQLDELNYSVCALGDSSYEKFCETGKQLDNRLKELKATPIIPRVDCDEDFSETASSWIKATCLELYGNGRPVSTSDQVLAKPHVFTGMLKNNVLLSSDTVKQPIYHLELIVNDDISEIQPGDSIDIKPVNPDWIVKDVLDILGQNDNVVLKNQLLNELEITSLTKTVLKKYQEITNNDELEELLRSKVFTEEFICKANLIDLLSRYPSDVDADKIVGIIPKLKRRLYSVASYSQVFPNEIHLTVKTVRFDYSEQKHEGSASVYLNEDIKEGNTFSFKHRPAHEFRLPEDKNDKLIMIGVGTGIAPFRAFLQQRENDGIKGKCWLIWGDKHREHDFLYEKELNTFLKNKTLARLDLAFSRDTKQKKYVQHLLEENSEELTNWLTQGAHIYVCGSVKMADSVKDTVTSVLESNGQIPLFDTLIKQNRYHEDAY